MLNRPPRNKLVTACPERSRRADKVRTKGKAKPRPVKSPAKAKK